MKQINIYLENTIKFGCARPGVVGYILEYISASGKAVTLSAGVAFDSATMNQAEIAALIKAISRIGEPSYIKVYTSNTWMKSLLNGWLEKWRANGWRKSNGQRVENADIISILSVMIGDQEIIAVGDDHPYRNWLKEETRKAAFFRGENDTPFITIPCE